MDRNASDTEILAVAQNAQPQRGGEVLIYDDGGELMATVYASPVRIIRH